MYNILPNSNKDASPKVINAKSTRRLPTQKEIVGIIKLGKAAKALREEILIEKIPILNSIDDLITESLYSARFVGGALQKIDAFEKLLKDAPGEVIVRKEEILQKLGGIISVIKGVKENPISEYPEIKELSNEIRPIVESLVTRWDTLEVIDERQQSILMCADIIQDAVNRIKRELGIRL